MSDKDNENQAANGFAEAVREHIAPVLAAQGFACSDQDLYVVSFSSVAIELALSYDPYSFEIDVTFARKADLSRRYALSDLLGVVSDALRKEHACFSASRPERVVECVRTIAGLLNEYGNGVLAGDAKAFERMGEISRLHNKMYTNELVQRPIRKAAEEAWRKHDYAKARDLYASIEPDLTLVEKKKLAYAQSYIARH
jgi:hypothetical protein